jgi:hypothetical protein
MKSLLFLILMNFLSNYSFGENLKAPEVLKYLEKGSCQTQDLAFSAVAISLPPAQDGTKFEVSLYLMDDGKASISYRNFRTENTGPNPVETTLSSEFVFTSWSQLGQSILVSKLGAIRYFDPMSNGRPIIYLDFDNSYFTKVPSAGPGHSYLGFRNWPDLNSHNETYSQVCQ